MKRFKFKTQTKNVDEVDFLEKQTYKSFLPMKSDQPLITNGGGVKLDELK